MATTFQDNAMILPTEVLISDYSLIQPIVQCVHAALISVRGTHSCLQCASYYSETSLIRHSMGPENNVGLGGCWIMECLSPYLCMVTVPHIMVGLERMLDYRGVGLVRFHCNSVSLDVQ